MLAWDYAPQHKGNLKRLDTKLGESLLFRGHLLHWRAVRDAMANFLHWKHSLIIEERGGVSGRGVEEQGRGDISGVS